MAIVFWDEETNGWLQSSEPKELPKLPPKKKQGEYDTTNIKCHMQEDDSKQTRRV